jgi:hypothetical protein
MCRKKRADLYLVIDDATNVFADCIAFRNLTDCAARLVSAHDRAFPIAAQASFCASAFPLWLHMMKVTLLAICPAAEADGVYPWTCLTSWLQMLSLAQLCSL